ncbi:GNAT family N-acetyltransferase, partial [Streptosporangium algeriense]
AEAGVDTAAAPTPPGYRLFSWDGTVPDDLADTFTASRRAMDDMPMDELDYGVVVWDVERVRAAARAVAERGDLLHTVVAVDDADGSIAGFTELVVPGDGRGDGQHYGTGVLPEHRGHGLARWMKAEIIRRTRERYPHLGGLLTDTADGNVHMRAVNDALGYLPTHREVRYQLDL